MKVKLFRKLVWCPDCRGKRYENITARAAKPKRIRQGPLLICSMCLIRRCFQNQAKLQEKPS